MGLPSPPFVPVEGVCNFRDIGGYPATSLSSVRRNWIFRSAQPGGITLCGAQKLRDTGIIAVIDLRSAIEIKETGSATTPVAEIEGTSRISAPVFSDEQFSAQTIGTKLESLVAGGIEVSDPFEQQILRQGAIFSGDEISG